MIYVARMISFSLNSLSGVTNGLRAHPFKQRREIFYVVTTGGTRHDPLCCA
jgi:hypothetical protein